MSQSPVKERTTANPTAVLQRTIELLGKRWTSVILWTLLSGHKQFRQITNYIPEISDRMLSERLKELKQAGLVERTVIPDTPVRINYSLTEKGQSLRPVLEHIVRWAEENLAHTGHN